MIGSYDYSSALSKELDNLIAFDQEYMKCLQEEKDFKELIK
jgi:hypothetical protein